MLRYLRPFIESYPRIAMTFRAMRNTWRSFHQPDFTPMGFFFVGNHQMQSGSFEPCETDLTNLLLDKSDVLINVGANIGYYVCMALNKNVKVVAFEPDQFNVKNLLRNVELNGWGDEVEIYPLAITDHIGITNLYGGGTGASIVSGYSNTSPAFSNLSPCNSLENVIGDRFSGDRLLVIIDVEGAELSVLKGAKKILESNPSPAFIVEIAVHENQPKGTSLNPSLLATFELFWNSGYKSWSIEEEPQLISRERIEAVMSGGLINTASRNFLFLKGSQAFNP